MARRDRDRELRTALSSALAAIQLTSPITLDDMILLHDLLRVALPGCALDAYIVHGVAIVQMYDGDHLVERREITSVSG